jgi:hypothetical protein
VQTGSRVRFAVTWKNATRNCNSITAWRGTLSGNALRTRWSLSYVDAQGQLRTLVGRDTFRKAN